MVFRVQLFANEFCALQTLVDDFSLNFLTELVGV
jgi:hypothetical protein